ncbi:MAG TPA: serine/threonine-protein kinase [Noviherbaspirillum sp.]|nr:serine/threonine-protein kinase [Noviherbaspirillum sp.]
MTTPSAAAQTNASPAVTRVGRFYLTRELGRGTVGCVYLGHDPVLDRDIAIKTFNPRLTPAERNRYESQFINEARAAGRLAHPHIVTIYEASSEGGTAYIAMEYLQGRGLHRLLDSGHRFTPDEVASIIWKMADALSYAHQHGVVHRDIKPANIFLVNDEYPKLIDFGIARAPNRVTDQPVSAEEQFTLYEPDKMLGTPNYMSPEQALGKPADERSDIYSLGAVMFEMLVGRTPFRSDSAHKLLQQIAYKAPPAPHEIDAKIPLALSEIVMHAMSKRPEKRYQNAEQMALDLRRYVMKQRRTHRRMQLALAPAEPRREPPAVRRQLRWIAILSLGVAAVGALAAIRLLR